MSKFNTRAVQSLARQFKDVLAVAEAIEGLTNIEQQIADLKQQVVVETVNLEKVQAATLEEKQDRDKVYTIRIANQKAIEEAVVTARKSTAEALEIVQQQVNDVKATALKQLRAMEERQRKAIDNYDNKVASLKRQMTSYENRINKLKSQFNGIKEALGE